MMNNINQIKWKCRRGLRELDLLFREMMKSKLYSFNPSELSLLDDILDYDDQTLFDFIFKDVSLGNSKHEMFIIKELKHYKID